MVYRTSIIYDGTRSQSSASIDIVFVHGFQGIREDPWDSPSQSRRRGPVVNWVRDFLPKDVPGSRIIKFDHDLPGAQLFGQDGKSTFAELAIDLLYELSTLRSGRGETSRPIVFIACSLGGLIVKNALNICLQSQNNFHRGGFDSSIATSTMGVIFLASPNRPSPYMSRTTSNHSRTTERALDRLAEMYGDLPRRSRLFRGFIRDTIDTINEDFVKILDHFHIASASEATDRKISSVLPKYMTEFNNRGEHTFWLSDSNEALGRFNTPKSKGYQRTLLVIKKFRSYPQQRCPELELRSPKCFCGKGSRVGPGLPANRPPQYRAENRSASPEYVEWNPPMTLQENVVPWLQNQARSSNNHPVQEIDYNPRGFPEQPFEPKSNHQYRGPESNRDIKFAHYETVEIMPDSVRVEIIECTPESYSRSAPHSRNYQGRYTDDEGSDDDYILDSDSDDDYGQPYEIEEPEDRGFPEFKPKAPAYLGWR